MLVEKAIKSPLLPLSEVTSYCKRSMRHGELPNHHASETKLDYEDYKIVLIIDLLRSYVYTRLI